MKIRIVKNIVLWVIVVGPLIAFIHFSHPQFNKKDIKTDKKLLGSYLKFVEIILNECKADLLNKLHSISKLAAVYYEFEMVDEMKAWLDKNFKGEFDCLLITDASPGVVYRVGNPQVHGDYLQDPQVLKALRNIPTAGIIKFDKERRDIEKVVDDLLVEGAVPLYSKGGKIIGTLVGAKSLQKTDYFISKLKQTIADFVSFTKIEHILNNRSISKKMQHTLAHGEIFIDNRYVHLPIRSIGNELVGVLSIDTGSRQSKNLYLLWLGICLVISHVSWRLITKKFTTSPKLIQQSKEKVQTNAKVSTAVQVRADTLYLLVSNAKAINIGALLNEIKQKNIKYFVVDLTSMEAQLVQVEALNEILAAVELMGIRCFVVNVRASLASMMAKNKLQFIKDVSCVKTLSDVFDITKTKEST